jgi:hypothetical protein
LSRQSRCGGGGSAVKYIVLLTQVKRILEHLKISPVNIRNTENFENFQKTFAKPGFAKKLAAEFYYK